MKNLLYVVSFTFLFSLCANSFAGETDVSLRTIVGARIGLSGFLMDASEFNGIYQEIKPNQNMFYYPLVSQFGASLEQLFKLGRTNHNFSIQSVLLFGGMEKSLIMTTFCETIGFRLSNGFLLGLGPIVVFNDELAEKKKKSEFFFFSGDFATLSLEYSVEKRFDIDGILIPVNFRVMLNPKDSTWKCTLVTGFDFETNNMIHLR